MAAIGGRIHLPNRRAPVPADDKMLVAFLGLGAVQIEPARLSVARVAVAFCQYAIGAEPDVEPGPGPMNAIGAGGVSDPIKPTRVIPQLKEPVGRVVEQAVRKRRRDRSIAAVQLESCLGQQYRAALNFRKMPFALERTVGNQMIVDEKLPSAVARDSARRGRCELRHNIRRGQRSRRSEHLPAGDGCRPRSDCSLCIPRPLLDATPVSGSNAQTPLALCITIRNGLCSGTER